MLGKASIDGWPPQNSCASLLCQAKLRIEIYFVVFYCKKEKDVLRPLLIDDDSCMFDSHCIQIQFV